MSRGLLVVAAMLLLAAGTPVASAGLVRDDTGSPPSSVVPDAGPSPSLPFRPAPEPHGGCVLPVSPMAPCELPRHREPVHSCVLPVLAGTGLLLPRCPHPEPMPEGRTVPLHATLE